MDDRVAAEVRSRVEGQVEIAEDRREVVVVVPPDQDRRDALLQEPQDLLHFDPLVHEVLRELVFEVARDDDLLGLPAVEHLAQSFEDDSSLESRDRDALLGECALESKVEVGDHKGPLVAEEECEIARGLNAFCDLDAVHGAPKDARLR